MSKCQEELDKWFNTHAYGSQKLAARIWQVAWNARGKVDAEICRNESVELIGPGDEAYNSAIHHCAEAIAKENENV